MSKLSLKKTAPIAVIPSSDNAAALHSAIVSDDYKLCAKLLVADASLTKLCYGRFPVLSLLYLYDSQKTIRKLGARFRDKTDYVFVDEHISDYTLFRDKAGRSLRLFGEGIVAPEDMIAVLGDAPTLRAISSKASADKAGKAAKIFTLAGNGKAELKNGKLKVPHTRKMDKLQTIAVILITVIALLFLGGSLGMYYKVPVLFGGDGSQSAPFYIYNPEQFTQAAKDSPGRYFTLKEDLTLSASELSTINVQSNISGEGHTIKVEDLNNSPLFLSISGNVSELTFDFGDIDVKFDENSALLAGSVSGTIANVKLLASGTITDISGNTTVKFGCLTAENSGTISRAELELKLNVIGASASGVTSEDVTFAGIAAVNSGLVTYCNVSADSEINLDTVDGAAIVAENKANGRVLDSVNNAPVIQTTSYHNWSPNTGGVVLTNYGTINNCYNNGAVTTLSLITKEAYEEAHPGADNAYPLAYAGGIVCTNYGKITHSRNTGDISVSTRFTSAMGGGIAALNLLYSQEVTATISGCASSGVLQGTTEVTEDKETSPYLFLGGIVGTNGLYSYVENSFSLMEASATEYERCFYGGILGTQITQLTYDFFLQAQIQIVYDTVTNSYYLDDKGFSYSIGSLTYGRYLNALSFGYFGGTDGGGYFAYNIFDESKNLITGPKDEKQLTEWRDYWQ